MAFNVSSRRGNTGQNGSKVRKNIWTEIVKTAREPGHYPAFYWISPKYWLIHDTVEASGMKRFKNMHIIRGLAAPGNRNWNCNGKMPLGIKSGTLISSIHFCWLLTMNRKNWIVSFCMQNKVHRLESSFQYCLCAINWKSIFIDRWPLQALTREIKCLQWILRIRLKTIVYLTYPNQWWELVMPDRLGTLQEAPEFEWRR